MSQWNYIKLEIGIQDSLLRQWNGFEDSNNLNFSKIVLKFAIFEYFVFVFFWVYRALLANEAFQVLQMGYLN